jgi:hypothetical protein
LGEIPRNGASHYIYATQEELRFTRIKNLT